MSARPSNTQLFALRTAPPAVLVVRDRRYELQKVFKHDFFAATALYASAGPGDGPEQIVAKFGRELPFCGIPGKWMGRFLRKREQRFHRFADGVPGVQRWVEQISDTAYALEYLPGRTLDTVKPLPNPGEFFDALRALLDALHARGIAYCDLNKRSNILVGPDGLPGLIDFQIALVLDPAANRVWRWLFGRAIAYFQRADLYHLYKHKRRIARDCLRPEEAALGTRGKGVAIHRKLTTPIRRLRRKFLTRQHRKGQLVSPSEHLESHEQPEKATWRKN